MGLLCNTVTGSSQKVLIFLMKKFHFQMISCFGEEEKRANTKLEHSQSLNKNRYLNSVL